MIADRPTSYWFEGVCAVHCVDDQDFYVSGSVLMYEDQFGEFFLLTRDTVTGEFVAFMEI